MAENVKSRDHELTLRVIGCTPALSLKYSFAAAAIAASGAICDAFTALYLTKLLLPMFWPNLEFGH